ncbi:MAG: PAS domain S-box protein [Chitinophagaceae bacterium]
METNLKLLMLEDDPADAELIQTLLQRAGLQFNAVVASNEGEFLEAMKDNGYHAVLADNALPQYSSMEALKIIRANNPYVAFILVTGTVSEEFAVNIIKQGADDYILKHNLTRLPAAISNAISKKKAEWEKEIAEKEIEKEKELSDSIVNSLPGIFYLCDSEGKFLRWNKNFERISGYNAEEISKMSPQYFFTPKGKESIEKYIEQSIATGFGQIETIFVTRQGKKIPYFFTSMATRMDHSDCLICVGLDISASKQSEKEKREALLSLMKSEENYRTFLHRITDAFIAFDKNLCFSYMNIQAAQLLQKKPEDLIGKNVWELFPAAVGSATFDALNKAITEQQYVTSTDYFAPLDLWQENHIYPSPDGLSVFVRDITEKKKLELKLRQQEREEQLNLISIALEAQEKERNAIGQELHDNVNQILVGTNLLLKAIKDNPANLEEFITTCMDNISNAVNENRKIAHEMVKPNLADGTFVQQLTRLSQSMLGPSGLKVSFNLENFSEVDLAEDQKLTAYRVAQEQCSNIAKYAQAQEVVITLSVSDTAFNMRIVDDGVGTDLSKLTEGVGLRNFVNRLKVHDGKVHIDSSPGKGFAVEIEMPVV